MNRRLAAVLQADVVGYSRLMEADEAGTLAVLKQRRRDVLQPVLREHGGRIVKFMGDGVLIEFASAVAAVKAENGNGWKGMPDRSSVESIFERSGHRFA